MRRCGGACAEAWLAPLVGLVLRRAAGGEAADEALELLEESAGVQLADELFAAVWREVLTPAAPGRPPLLLDEASPSVGVIRTWGAVVALLAPRLTAPDHRRSLNSLLPLASAGFSSAAADVRAATFRAWRRPARAWARGSAAHVALLLAPLRHAWRRREAAAEVRLAAAAAWADAALALRGQAWACGALWPPARAMATHGGAAVRAALLAALRRLLREALAAAWLRRREGLARLCELLRLARRAEEAEESTPADASELCACWLEAIAVACAPDAPAGVSIGTSEAPPAVSMDTPEALMSASDAVHELLTPLLSAPDDGGPSWLGACVRRSLRHLDRAALASLLAVLVRRRTHAAPSAVGASLCAALLSLASPALPSALCLAGCEYALTVAAARRGRLSLLHASPHALAADALQAVEAHAPLAAAEALPLLHAALRWARHAPRLEGSEARLLLRAWRALLQALRPAREQAAAPSPRASPPPPPLLP
ncbi:hypothetical protein AB1Y20_012431 [Prymnesium parvum]|uniref:Telomere-associated protein Rif1 N-terminal domain-containing protein n=1 Tax=Prymnesium parvum TaxID=97485 RepID=A0AB34IHW9_PRYPA